MDPYDSDSSGLEDAGEYTETGVLLGYAAKEPTDDTISHLGGWPTWLDEKTPPPGDLAKCKVCNNPMLLLIQLNGDLPEYFLNDERRLYIFGCPKRACDRKAGSVRAFRGIRKLKAQTSRQSAKKQEQNPEQEKQPVPEKDLGTALFGAASSNSDIATNTNPFSTSSNLFAQAASNPFAPLPPASSLAAKPPQNLSNSPINNLSETFASKARLSSPGPPSAPVVAGPSLPWPPQSAFPSPYPEYYLDAEYETLSRPSTPTIPPSTMMVGTDDEDTSNSGTVEPKDTFESSLDKSFLRFSTRLSHNPEQVLRYEFRGSPLLYSHIDVVAKLFPQHQSNGSGVHVLSSGSTHNRIPRCNACGRERVFELQLVPHAISVLEEGRKGIGLGKDDAGMEWGTIILGVCAGDCGPDKVGEPGWREEWIGVQWEEMKR